MLHTSSHHHTSNGEVFTNASPTFGGGSSINSYSVRLPMSEQIMQIKNTLQSVIHTLVDKEVDDTLVKQLVSVADQLDGIAGRTEQRVSIAIPPFVVPAQRMLGDSPNNAPISANTRIKQMDLNDIPTYKVDNNNGGGASGDISPLLSALPKKKSVVFFRDDSYATSAAVADDEGHRFVARSYSGFGSFRKASMRVSMMGGNLQLAPQRGLSFKAEGMPAFDLNGDDLGIRSRFSRPIARHSAVFVDPTQFIDACLAAGASLLDIDVDAPNTNLLSLEAEEAEVLKTVAVKIFSQYSFMSGDTVDANVLIQFVDAVSRYNNVTNPFRNGLHTADTLLAVHHYLRQPDVGNNFTDGELSAMLVAALCVNLGYLGTTNEFLLQLSHPLTRIFGVVSTSESAASMTGIQLLDQYNFLAHLYNGAEGAVHWFSLQESITELLVDSGPRFHQAQLKQALAMVDRGFVADEDVPSLMSCVIRAAMMRSCCKPKSQHIRCAELWVNEAYKQSECERILKFSETPQWTNDTAWSSVQAYVTMVALPFFESLQEFFPEEWAEQIPNIAALYGTPESPIANKTASFRNGAAPVSISIDTGVPDWSDQSTPVLNILTTIIPHHLLLNASTGRVGTASRHRMDHYFSFLQLYDSYEKDMTRAGDFGGSLVQLALKLDPLYIGEYASALVDEDTWGSYADAAAMIIQTEVTPDVAAVLSPARRTYQSTDSFILLLLKMMHDRLQGAPASSTTSSMVSNGPGRQTPTHPNPSDAVRSVFVSQGPFRGKWRLSTGGSVYDNPKKQ